MDFHNSSAYATAATPPPARKVRRCLCGRGMSSPTHDFLSFCIICRGIDCATDNRCAECAEVSDELC